MQQQRRCFAGSWQMDVDEHPQAVWYPMEDRLFMIVTNDPPSHAITESFKPPYNAVAEAQGVRQRAQRTARAWPAASWKQPAVALIRHSTCPYPTHAS